MLNFFLCLFIFTFLNAVKDNELRNKDAAQNSEDSDSYEYWFSDDNNSDNNSDFDSSDSDIKSKAKTLEEIENKIESEAETIETIREFLKDNNINFDESTNIIVPKEEKATKSSNLKDSITKSDQVSEELSDQVTEELVDSLSSETKPVMVETSKSAEKPKSSSAQKTSTVSQYLIRQAAMNKIYADLVAKGQSPWQIAMRKAKEKNQFLHKPTQQSTQNEKSFGAIPVQQQLLLIMMKKY
jgi:hypothetical protein